MNFGAGVDVDAQEFCQERRRVLTVAERVTPASAVAEREVQIPIRTKTHLSAFVIAERLGNLKQDTLGLPVGLIRVTGGHLQLTEDAAPRIHRSGLRILLIIINIKQPVRSEPGMEGDAEQTLLVIDERLSINNVEKLLRLAPICSLADDEDPSVLLHDKQASRAIRCF